MISQLFFYQEENIKKTSASTNNLIIRYQWELASKAYNKCGIDETNQRYIFVDNVCNYRNTCYLIDLLH